MQRPGRVGYLSRMVLTRESIRNGILQRILSAGDQPIPVLTDAERDLSRHALLGQRAPGEDVWVFGYGSLIWNPAFHFVERRLAKIHGYHRHYCLWTHKGRGCPEQPGLVLALDRGGSCRGVVFRIAADAVEMETGIIWQREMVASSYTPRWVRARTDNGPVRAIAFIIDRQHHHYAGRLPRDQIIDVLATARGGLGSSADYLFSTAEHLAALGIHDHRLAWLQEQVAARLNGA